MWQILTILVLFGMMTGLAMIPGPEAVNLIAATGFVLLAAFTTGEFFKRLRLPALLGYIVAGIIFGPEFAYIVLGPEVELGLVPEDFLRGEQLVYIEILTVGVIGTLGGGELKLEQLKGQLGTIATVTGLSFLAIVPFTAAVVYLMAGFAPDMVPFLADVPTPTRISASLLFGVFGFAMSPAATLAIIQETRSKGPFTSLVLGVVIVADLVLVAAFLLTSSFSSIMIETGTFALAPLLAELPTIGAEFMWALIIGAVTGAVFILYFRFVAQEMIVFTVGAIFVATYACNQLHAEKLLAFITAGFIVQNLSRHGHDMIEALERISLPVFVLYFTLKAADLNLGGMSQYVVLTGVLTVVRTLSLYGAVNLSTKIAGGRLTQSHERYLWISFFSRGGVDLVLASLLAGQAAVFGPWVVDFQAVIMAVVVVHIVAGPPLLKYALDSVGETQGERGAGERDEELIEEEPRTEEREEFLEDPLPVPNFTDQQLQEHLSDLRTRLTRLYKSSFVQPIRSHEQAIAQIHARIDERVDEALADLREMLEGADPEESDLLDLAEDVRDRHKRLRQSLQTQVELVEQIEPAPVTPELVDDVFADLRDMEDYDRHFRVEWEPRIWEPRRNDRFATRFLKFGRRAYKGVFGPGHRTVPVGRLWRYFVELSLPEYLAGAVVSTSEKHEAFWFELGENLREVDALFERTVQTLGEAGQRRREARTPPGGETEASPGSEQPEVLSVPMSASPESVPYFSDMDVPEHLRRAFDKLGEREDTRPEAGEELEGAVGDPVEHCLERMDAFEEAHEERSKFLHAEQTGFRARLLDRLAIAFERTFSEYLTGVEKAGTIQLPGFRYRPSARFDRSRRAEHRLDDRLGREAEIVSGYQGWIVIDQKLVGFLNWFYEYRQRIAGVLEQYIRQDCIQKLRNLQSRCSERPQAYRSDERKGGGEGGGQPVDWSAWFDDQLDPSLDRARRAMNHALFELGQGNATQQLLDLLETRVSRFPGELRLLVELPGEVVGEEQSFETITVPVRRWYGVELIREAALRFVEFNEHAERSLRRSLIALEEIEQILEFNLKTGQTKLDEETDASQMNTMAEGGLERAHERITDLSEALLRDENELRHWIKREMCRIVCVASAPFLTSQVADIPERLRQRTGEMRRGGQGGRMGRLTGPIRRGLSQLKRRIEPVYREISEDLKEALTEKETTPSGGEIRSRLLRDEPIAFSSIPVIYRRLFTPIPIDIPDFYVPRLDLEQRCMEAVMQWFHGRPSSILIHGDRGMGKRTLIHHLLPVQLFDTYSELNEEQLMTVHLGDRFVSEETLCRTLSPLAGGESVRSLNTLAGQIHDQQMKRIAFIEDGHNLFLRTPAGVARLQRFLEFMSRTSDQVLWIVMFGKTAATYLDTAIDLYDYFTHAFEVEPLETEQIEEMITTRHRVSGFHLDFRAPETRIVDRLRHPIAASEAARHPREAYFERLGRLSGGNPMLGLLYWLESVRPDPEDDTRFIVEPLPNEEMDILPALSLEQQLVLASVIRHGTASIVELAQIFREPENAVRVELEHLARLGLVETLPGREGTYRLRRLAEGLVTPELREENLV